jgi:hypothetical protein
MTTATHSHSVVIVIIWLLHSSIFFVDSVLIEADDETRVSVACPLQSAHRGFDLRAASLTRYQLSYLEGSDGMFHSFSKQRLHSDLTFFQVLQYVSFHKLCHCSITV